MSAFWTSLGEAGHLVVYLGLLSIAGAIFAGMSKLGGVLGKVGGLLKGIVDFFSANLAHPKE